MTWRSNDRDHHGIVNTDKLEWSDTELDKLRKRPFSLTGEIHVTSINRESYSSFKYTTYDVLYESQ